MTILWQHESASEALRSLPTMASLAAGAGVLSHHLIFRRYEVDSLAWEIVGVLLAGFLALWAANVLLAGFGVVDSFVRAVIVGNTYNISTVASILVYRAFFHPLNRFPGPVGARLSRFYACRKAAQTCQGCIDVEKMHAEYGDVVRTGPHMLSFCSPDAIKQVYGPPTKTTRSPWYAQVSNDVNVSSVNSCRDLDLHERRKKAWTRALGSKALTQYRPRIEALAELLLAKIEEKQGEPIDMTAHTIFYGFDVMAEVGMSKHFHMIENGAEHPAIRGLHSSMMAIGIVGCFPWLLSMLSKVPGAASEYVRFTTWCHGQLQAKRKAYENEVDSKDKIPQDIITWLLKAQEEGDRSAAPSYKALEEDNRLLIIAGSDTAASAMANTLYLLASNQDSYKTLQQELRRQFPNGDADWSHDKAVSGVPYLDYVLLESLRLRPPVPGGLNRTAPPAGLTIDGIHIPGDTVMTVPTWTIQRDPRYWSDPLSFKPERWASLSTESVPFIAFTRGRWVCPGRALAMMEMRTLIGRMALRFDMALAEDGAKFEAGMKDTFTMTLPPLPLVFTPVDA